ncbi:MAG TPA: NAD-dependent epimerase/dehydratase family protein [Ferruginibacter sp.]|nr:NAD-dependent epimerase/dehydratase family protein [Ferruginibacter sp.]HMP20699.1 NAD-dependent epimerase/dehydratase family protein [Ferruginibacter sp.]
MILVTGGAGLVGRELIAQLLAKGEAVTAIYHKTALPAFNSPLLTALQCDILDVVGLEALMQGIDKVYHCAALVNFTPSRKQELYKINVEGTANVVNAALQASVKKILHVSSVAALGRIRKNEVVNENMQWTPGTSNSNYGQSKYLGEMEVWRGAGEGLEAVVVNPSIILGPGNWNSGSAQMFKSVYDGFPWYSEGVTGFVDVRDVAKAMIELMDSDISGERFILSAHNRTYKEVFELIAKAFGKKAPHKKVTPLLAALVWRLEKIKSLFNGKAPLVTKETAETALVQVKYDNSKLKKFLPGFEYRLIEDTVQYTCEQLLKQNG